MSTPARSSGVRLAELIAALSLATDLGLGQPMEHVLRSSRIAFELGQRLELDESRRVVVYYVGLLAWAGCHSDAHEQARWFGDDIALKADIYDVDLKGLAAARFTLGHIGAGDGPLRRARTVAELLLSGGSAIDAMEGTHCLIAGELASRLGLGASVRDPLQQVFERWDGKGVPAGLRGEELDISVRLVQLADVVAVFHRRGGVGAAVAVARERSGTQFDPGLVDRFCEEAPELLAAVDSGTSWDAIVEAEPALGGELTEAELDAALEAVADFADLKSPFLSGHSRSVADLAADAARSLGAPELEVVVLRRAALVHDLGKLGVSNRIWDKPGPLSDAEWERVRLHPYLVERMLAYSNSLAPLGTLAAQHHERLDGSGYPRGLTGSALTMPARILAAADVYRALLEPRPHRPPRSREEAVSELRAQAATGRLDGQAAEAVLGAAGHRVARRRESPAGLTPREVEVLRAVARGVSKKQIAGLLHISTKTVRNHVEHIYSKIDVSSRAAASLFAMRHGLLTDLDTPANEANAPSTAGTASRQASRSGAGRVRVPPRLRRIK